MSAGDDGITVFGQNGRGGHSVGLRAGSVAVLLTSDGPETDAACVELAHEIRSANDRLEIRAAQVERHEAEVESLRAKLRVLTAERDALRDTIEHATRGARRFNGPVLCKPHSADAWDGAVWLLDPEKQDGGFGLYFASLAEVRRAHPELWIVGLSEGGILLDARPLGGVAR